jgi:hypothetical protein
MYLGMVTNRPALANIYAKLRFMLGTSNPLNTSNAYFYSNKVKDITMSNQQEAKNLMPHLWRCIHLFGILRGYIRRIVHTGWYSPTFCIYINFGSASLINVRLNKLLKKDLPINLNNRYHTKGDKLDPHWVSGFVDYPPTLREGCFSIIIEISGPFKWKVRTSHGGRELLIRELLDNYKLL